MKLFTFRAFIEKSANITEGLPDGAKFGKYCQKSLFSKKFVNFFWEYFLCQKFACFEGPIL